MNPGDPELEALRLKIGRIETDLINAKESLARLESDRPPSAQVEPTTPEVATPPMEPPRLIAEPPLLNSGPTQPKPRPIRDWLVSCHLWPPSDEGDVEVRLAAWWTTRLGALLAIIGAVFFAVYVSRHSSPMVKLIELLAVSFGVAAVGLWLERSVPKFARLLVGTGLALLYFSTVAAYAIPATRVITDAPIAIAMQLSVVTGIGLFALWRRSESTVTMAILLGYGSALAGCYAELDSVILWSALGLGLIAVVVKWKAGWRSPSVVAVPLMYATYAAFYFWKAPQVGPPFGTEIWLPLLVALALFFLRDGLTARRSGGELSRDDRMIQNLNTSLAISAGWSVTWHVLPESLEMFYFGSAAILFLLAYGWHAAKQTGSLVVVTATQASAMLALGLVTHFQGHLTSLVLLAQVAGMLVASRLSGMRGLRVIVYLVWIYSLYHFIDALGQRDSVPEVIGLLYLGLSAAILSFDQRWNQARVSLSYLTGVLLGIAAWSTMQFFSGTPWKALWLGGVSLTLCVAGWPARAWRGAGVAAGITVFGMFAAVANYRARDFETWQHWTHGAGMFLVVVLIALFWDRMNRSDRKGTRWWRGAFVILASLALELIFWKGLRHGQDVACAAATAVVLLTISPWAKRWPLAIAGVVGLAYGLYLHHPFGVRQDYPMLLLAAALAWVLPVIWQHFERCRTSVVNASWRRAMPWWQAGLATWIVLLALQSNFEGGQLYLLTTVEAVAIFFLAWKLRVKVAWPAASVILLFGVGWIVAMLLRGEQWAGQAGFALNLTGVLSLIVALLVLPLVARDFGKEPWNQRALLFHGLIALMLYFWFFAAQQNSLSVYTTVIWGGGALGVFGLGLFLQTRIYRLLGLLGLVLCVPRIFLIDLNSTLYRIIAFVVLGVVLLWVGFSYHRFRHLVTGEVHSRKPE